MLLNLITVISLQMPKSESSNRPKSVTGLSARTETTRGDALQTVLSVSGDKATFTLETSVDRFSVRKPLSMFNGYISIS